MNESSSTTQPPSPHFLHPLSLVFEVLSIARHNLVPAIIAAFSAARGGYIGTSIGILAFAITIVVAIIRFATFRYYIDAGELVVEQGLVFRTHRTIPLDRIQNIDVVQNPLHRLLRVGEARIETASGKEPEAVMRVLTLTEVQSLRDSVIRERQLQHPIPPSPSSDPLPLDDNGSMTSTASVIAVEPEPSSGTLVYAIPTQRLILAGLLSNRGLIIAGIAYSYLVQQNVSYMRLGINPDAWFVGGTEQVDTEALQHDVGVVRQLLIWLQQSFGPLSAIALTIVALAVLLLILRGASALWYVLRFHGYELRLHNKDLKVRCGLLTKVSATIPRDRIQFISIHETWLGRRMGIASIRIETAGGGDDREDAAATVGRRWFVPVIPKSSVAGLISTLNPLVDLDDSRLDWKPLSRYAKRRMTRMALVLGLVVGGIGLWLQPLWGWSIGLAIFLIGYAYAMKKSKSRKFARTAWGVLFRSGVMLRKCSIAFADKVQLVSVHQSPFDRRWKMATLSLDTAGAGPADHRIEVHMLDAAFALAEQQAIYRSANDRTIGL